MSDPVVSVIIPVYNALPWLSQCLESIRCQSLDAADIEIVAVDDASTDGSATELDRWAEQLDRLRVIRLPTNSGSAAKPCNIGAAVATGRYLFFLDADARFDPQALRRLVTMADESAAEIVLAKPAVAAGDYRRPPQIWQRDRADVTLFDMHVYDLLDRHKLFSAELFNRIGRRFTAGPAAICDQGVVAAAYLSASTISVVADRDCYRPRAKAATPISPRAYLGHLDEMAELIAEHLPPGDHRDQLLERHIRIELLVGALGGWLEELSDADRDDLLDSARDFLNRWMTAGIRGRLAPKYRVMAYCVQRGKVEELTDVIRHHQFGVPGKAITVDGGVYAGLPFFRNPAAGIPDHCYDLTTRLAAQATLTRCVWDGSRVRLSGYAFIPFVDTEEQTVTVLARDRHTGDEYCVVAGSVAVGPGLPRGLGTGGYNYDHAGFEVELDLATLADGGPLPDGSWELLARVRAHGVTRCTTLAAGRGAARSPGCGNRLLGFADRPAALVTTGFDPVGGLTIDIAGRRAAATELVRLTGCESTRTGMAVVARSSLTAWPDGSSFELCLVRGRTTKTIPADIEQDDGGFGLTAALPPPRLSLAPGWWGMGLRLSWRDGIWEVPVHDSAGEQVWLRGRPSIWDVIGMNRGSVRA